MKAALRFLGLGVIALATMHCGGSSDEGAVSSTDEAYSSLDCAVVLPRIESIAWEPAGGGYRLRAKVSLPTLLAGFPFTFRTYVTPEPDGGAISSREVHVLHSEGSNGHHASVSRVIVSSNVTVPRSGTYYGQIQFKTCNSQGWTPLNVIVGSNTDGQYIHVAGSGNRGGGGGSGGGGNVDCGSCPKFPKKAQCVSACGTCYNTDGGQSFWPAGCS